MFKHIHLLQKPTIEGKALALLLEANGYQVQFTPSPPESRPEKEEPVLLLANLEFLPVEYEAELKALDYITDYIGIILLGKLHHLYWFKSFQAPVKGFVSLESDPVTLLKVLNKIGEEKVICFGDDIQNFIQKTKLKQQNQLFEKKLRKPLTNTELKIMREITIEKPTKQIAKEQYRSIHTINNHRKNIKKKFKIERPFDLSIFCTRHIDAIHTLNYMLGIK